jgi:hypothetical protein
MHSRRVAIVSMILALLWQSDAINRKHKAQQLQVLTANRLQLRQRTICLRVLSRRRKAPREPRQTGMIQPREPLCRTAPSPKKYLRS